MTSDERYMSLALRLAERGLGRTSPNPPVGAVVVLGGEVVGCGWHRRAGMPHAEVEAISDAVRRGFSDLRGATMYVTLEPCCHYGRTPPCTQAIISAGFGRVVVGALDPNPAVCGRGVEELRRAGIEVTVGVLGERARRLIEAFEVYITLGRVFLAAKWAQSLDGRISAADGSSRWISCEKALRFAHRLRDRHDVVVIGAGTLVRDDPRLTVRLVRGRNPVRVVVAGSRRISPHHAIFRDGAARTIVVSVHENPFDGDPPGGVELWRAPADKESRVPMRWLAERLAQEGFTSALVEGGGKLIGSAIKEGVVDRIYAIVSPKLIGSAGTPAVDAPLAPKIEQAITLAEPEVRRLGEDILLSARLRNA